MGRDIAALVAGLSTDDKARLTTGRDAWSTAPLEAAGIPPVGMTDGPNGARGSAVLGAGEARSACVPCGSALGATWNPELIERVGTLLGEETRLRGARVLLAPTVNLHRSPLAGRNFECFSEDPLLSGRAAAAYVRGVQACGVAVTVKHLVGNEAETERYTMNSVIDPRALRELYLVPFELAVKEGGALGVMTSYNRFNGGYCANDAALLNGILRDEWGFEGFVVSDWYAVVSTIDAARAGLDLEMPGPGRAYGARLAAAVAGGDVPEADLDAAAGRLLGVFDRLGALDDPPEQEERFEDRPEHRAIAREAATESIVLLRNEGVLPLEPGSLRSLAVVGPNAERAQLMGGGSAKLRPYYRVAPLDAIRERFGAGVDVRHERGVDIDRTVPELPAPFRYEVFAGTELAGEPVRTGEREDGLLMFFRAPAEVPDPEAFSMRARGSFTAEAGGGHEFTLVLAGSGRLLVDGSPVVEAAAPPPGGEFFRMASDEIAGTLELAGGPDGRARARVVEPRRGGRLQGRQGRLPPAARPRRARPRGRGRRRGRRRDRRGRHQRRLGDRGARPRVDGPAGRPERARRARAPRQPAHGRRRQRRLAGHAARGPTARRRCSTSGSAGRRWRGRWPTCWRAPRTRPAGFRRPFRSSPSTTRRTATSRARTASAATARACSSDTAGTRRAGCRSASRSATASPTPRSSWAPRASKAASRSWWRST